MAEALPSSVIDDWEDPIAAVRFLEEWKFFDRGAVAPNNAKVAVVLLVIVMVMVESDSDDATTTTRTRADTTCKTDANPRGYTSSMNVSNYGVGRQ